MPEEEFQKLVLAEFRALHQEVQGIHGEIFNTNQEIGSIKQDIVSIKQDIANLKQEMSHTNQEIIGIKQEMSHTNQEIENTKQEIIDTRLEMRERFDRLERHNEANVVATLNVIHNKINEVHASLISVAEVLGDHEVRIRNLTRRPV